MRERGREREREGEREGEGGRGGGREGGREKSTLETLDYAFHIYSKYSRLYLRKGLFSIPTKLLYIYVCTRLLVKSASKLTCS